METHARLLCTLVLCVSLYLTTTTTTFAINKDELIKLIPNFADDSLINHPFPCSESEKQCFLQNKILYEEDGQCYTVREQGPCTNGHVFHVDKAEASKPDGRFRGTCANSCGDASKAPLAATGECMTHSEVTNNVCRSELYLTATRDLFGQWVCEWTRLPCQPPKFKRPALPSPPQDFCYPPTDAFRREGINLSSNETASDHPLFQLFSDTFYKQREFLCTNEEKECLQYGRLLDSNGNCYRAGDFNRKCGPGITFHLDKDEAKKENGHLRGKCSWDCHPYSAEPKENCYNFVNMVGVCRWDWGMNPTLDVFGQVVCYCLSELNISSTTSEPSEGLLPPASAPDHCKAPDFSARVKLPSNDKTLTIGFNGSCSEEEFACLRVGKVLMNGTCHTLRTRGPCAQGEELVLDKEALAHARLQPKCAPTPCPGDGVLIPIDGRCLSHQKVISLFCPDQMISLDEFGGWECNYNADFPANLSSIVRHSNTETCILQDTYFESTLIHPRPYP